VGEQCSVVSVQSSVVSSGDGDAAVEVVGWDGVGREPVEAWREAVEWLRFDMRGYVHAFRKYVEPLRLVAFRDGCFMVDVPDALSRDWAEARLTKLIERQLVGIMNMPGVSIQFSVVSEGGRDEG